MQPSLTNASTIPVLEQLAAFTEARHAVLAGNVTNFDTPGYRVRDLSPETFQERLAEAIESRRARQEPVSPGMLSEPDADMRQVRESMRTILYHDESDVGLEQQVAALTKNQMLHNLAISVMNSQFRLLQTAISERV